MSNSKTVTKNIKSVPNKNVTNDKNVLKQDNVTDIKVTKEAISSMNNERNSNPFLVAMSPMAAGISIFQCVDSEIFPDVVNTVTQFTVTGSKQLGVPFPKVPKVVSLCSGNHRGIKQAQAFFAANIKADGDANHEFKIFESRAALDWTCEEGLATLLPYIQKLGAKCCVVLEQHITGPVTVSFFSGLAKISAVAKEFEVCVFMTMMCPDACSLVGLDQCCDELIKVAACEKEPGYTCAFSFDFVSLAPLSVYGVGKKMVSVRLTEKNRFTRRCDPYIAADLQTRLMWLQRKQGKKLEAIAKFFGLDKSTIQRRLKGLASSENVSVSEKWVKSHEAALADISPQPSGFDDMIEQED
jgi:hypothetical protein